MFQSPLLKGTSKKRVTANLTPNLPQSKKRQTVLFTDEEIQTTINLDLDDMKLDASLEAIVKMDISMEEEKTIQEPRSETPCHIPVALASAQKIREKFLTPRKEDIERQSLELMQMPVFDANTLTAAGTSIFELDKPITVSDATLFYQDNRLTLNKYEEAEKTKNGWFNDTSFGRNLKLSTSNNSPNLSNMSNLEQTHMALVKTLTDDEDALEEEIEVEEAQIQEKTLHRLNETTTPMNESTVFALPAHEMRDMIDRNLQRLDRLKETKATLMDVYNYYSQCPMNDSSSDQEDTESEVEEEDLDEFVKKLHKQRRA